MDMVKYFARTHAATLIVGGMLILSSGLTFGCIVTVVALGVGHYLNPHPKG